jgi:hypothetical protein
MGWRPENCAPNVGPELWNSPIKSTEKPRYKGLGK